MNDNLDAALALMDGAPELINEPMTSELFQGAHTYAYRNKQAQLSYTRSKVISLMGSNEENEVFLIFSGSLTFSKV